MELTAKEILEKHWEANKGPTVTDEVLEAMKEACMLAFEAGFERGEHYAKCEVEGIHPQGRADIPQRRGEFINSLFPESK
jgi:hypothetical protein